MRNAAETGTETAGVNEDIYWMIETVDPEGNDLVIPFTGTYQQARRECHQFHPGATITPCRDAAA